MVWYPGEYFVSAQVPFTNCLIDESHVPLALESHRMVFRGFLLCHGPQINIHPIHAYGPLPGFPGQSQYCCFLTFLSVRSCVRSEALWEQWAMKGNGPPSHDSVMFHLCVRPLSAIKRINSLGTEILPRSLKLQASFTSLKSTCNGKPLSAKRQYSTCSVVSVRWTLSQLLV